MADIFGDDDDFGSNGASGASGAKKKDDFGALLEQSLKGYTKVYAVGDKVIGEVVSVGKEEVFVNIDGRDGTVAKSEFVDADGTVKVRVGDAVHLYVMKAKDTLMNLSTKVSSKAMSETIEDAYDFETPIDGRVVELTNGGFRVNIMGKMAFCPMSQMDIKPITEPSSYIDKKFEFIVTKFEGGRNIVVSRRRLLDLEKLENQGSFIDQHKPGEVLNGRVTRLEAYGAFVEVAPGVEGLVHISEISWSRLKHASEGLEMGQQITVKVLKVEEDANGRLKISLSRKQADEDPWMTAEAEFPANSIHNAKIQSKERFGFLMELKPGIVGLLPKSAFREVADERELEKKNPGEMLKVQIQAVNVADKRVSLSFPNDQDDQSWQQFNTNSSGSNASSSGKGLGTLADQFKGMNLTSKK